MQPVVLVMKVLNYSSYGILHKKPIRELENMKNFIEGELENDTQRLDTHSALEIDSVTKTLCIHMVTGWW